jgi:hypothetical protein
MYDQAMTDLRFLELARSVFFSVAARLQGHDSRLEQQ